VGERNENEEGTQGAPPPLTASDVDALIERRVSAEGVRTEALLVAQEHRMVPALVNVAEILFGRHRARRIELLPRALGALFWCLVPSGGTTAVGIVALLSLVVAWQQTQLLSAQNKKIEVQNMLAEAQRRAGLMFETSAIFQVLDEERRDASPKGQRLECGPSLVERCWATREAEKLFVPSRATTGRIAALTQALRPYRYLTVENQAPYRFGEEVSAETCPESIKSEMLDHAALIANNGVQGEDGKPAIDRSNGAAVRASMVEEAKRRSGTGGGRAWRDWALGAANSVVDVVRPDDSNLGAVVSCSPSSPERGQLLLSLYAASVDISHLVEGGADFRFSDLPGANLKGIVLQNVDLSFSRFPGATFSNGRLKDVKLNGSHLAGARFTRTQFDRVSLNDAVLQRGAAVATNASLFGAIGVTGQMLSGVRLIDVRPPFSSTTDRAVLFTKWCLARKLHDELRRQTSASGADGAAFKGWEDGALSGYALLTELQEGPRGATELAVIAPVMTASSEVLFDQQAAGRRVRVFHNPFNTCDASPSK
jgi:Pentapeptide repeats (8 copies)